MARIPKLDSAGKFLAADVNAQIDARTKATMRADLPALAKELKIGGGSGIEQVSGTVTLDASGDPIREFFTTGATTFKANGATTPLGAYTAVVWRRNSQGSWGYQVVQDSWTTPAPTPDTTAPVAGTLGVTVTDVKADLSVSGASDDRGYVSYSFSKDNGATWTAYQDSATYTFAGLTASTAYTFRHRVKDAAGNVTTGTAVSKTTAVTPPEVIPSGAYGDAVLSIGAPLHYLPLSDQGPFVSGYTLTQRGTAAAPVLASTPGTAPTAVAGIGDADTALNFPSGATFSTVGSIANNVAKGGIFILADTSATNSGFVGLGGAGLQILGSKWSPKLGSVTFTGSRTVTAGRHFLAVTWDGATVKTYVDGVLDTTTASTAYITPSGAASQWGLFAPNWASAKLAGLVVFSETVPTDAQVMAVAKAAGRA